MVTLVCENDKIGPECTDERREDAQPKKDDCASAAYWTCVKKVWDCRTDIVDMIRRRNGTYSNVTSSDSNPENSTVLGAGTVQHSQYLIALDDLECYSNDCRKLMLDCFCTGLSGLTCAVCGDKQPSGYGAPPPAPPGGKQPPGNQFNSQQGTISSVDGNIPIIFGRVFLTGNVIDFSEPYFVNTGALTPNGEPAVVQKTDLIISLCEGVVQSVPRRWAGDTIIYDETGDAKPETDFMVAEGFTMELLKGTETQKVSAISGRGFGRTPAYRGQAAIIFREYPTSDFGTSLPSFNFECATDTVSRAVGHTAGAWTIDTAKFSIDLISGRYYSVTANTITFGYVDSATPVGTYTAPADIGAIQITEDERDIVYQDSNLDLHFVYGYNHDQDFTLTLNDTAQVVAGYRVPSYLKKDFKVAAASMNGSIEFAAIFQDDWTLKSLKPYSNADVGQHTYATIGEFDEEAEGTFPAIYAYFIGMNDGRLYYDRLFLVNAYTGRDYSDLDTWTGLNADILALGCQSVTATIGNIVHIRNGNGFLVFFNDGPRKVASMILHSNLLAAEWTVNVPAIPVGPVMEHFEGSVFKYIAGDKLYSIDLATGVFQEQMTLSEVEAAPISAGQSYDGSTDALMYINDTGKLDRILPGRVLTVDATMDEVIEGICTRAGMDVTEYDTSLLHDVGVHGYIIQNQDSGITCLNELNMFYHMDSREGSRGFQVLPLGLATVIDVDDEDFSQLVVKERAVVDDLDLSYSEVTYFNSQNDGAADTQMVTRDFVLGDDSNDELADGESYSVNIYATATEARRAAEVDLLQRLQSTTTYTVNLLPRYLAIEPADFIVLDNGWQLLARNFSIDTGFALKVVGTKDDISFYQEETMLVGDATVADDTAFVQPTYKPNFLIRFNMPPAESWQSIVERKERMYFGQTNPDTIDFSPVEQFVKDTNGTYVDAGKPTRPVLIGRLISGLTEERRNNFTLDRVNTVVIKFNRDITIDDFTSALSTDIYDSFTRNLLIVGPELLQFLDFDVADDNRTVTFSNLYRGKFGTNRFMYQHAVNEDCAYYTEESFMWTDIPVNVIPLHFVHVALIDPVFSTRNKEAVSGYRPILDMQWPVAATKVSNGAVSWQTPVMKVGKPAIGTVDVGTVKCNPFVQEFLINDSTYGGADDIKTWYDVLLLKRDLAYDRDAVRAAADLHDYWNDFDNNNGLVVITPIPGNPNYGPSPNPLIQYYAGGGRVGVAAAARIPGRSFTNGDYMRLTDKGIIVLVAQNPYSEAFIQTEYSSGADEYNMILKDDINIPDTWACQLRFDYTRVRFLGRNDSSTSTIDDYEDHLTPGGGRKYVIQPYAIWNL